MEREAAFRHRIPRHVAAGLAVLLAVVGLPPALAATVSGPIKIHPSNRRYLMHGDTCKAIYLAGTHHRANIQDNAPDYPPAPFDFAGTYPPADAPRANFIRGWHWEHSRWLREIGDDDWVLPLPFARTGPGNAKDGKPRFNLGSYDNSYVSRLQNRAATAQNEGMVLSVMLFQGFSVQSLDPNEHPETNHPFQPENNTAGVDGDWTATYGGVAESHTRLASKPQALITAQDNYVRHIVASLNGYDRLIWEVSNESIEHSLAWQDYARGVIAAKELSLGLEKGSQSLVRNHLVWISHPQGLDNTSLFASKAQIVSPSWREPAVTASGGVVEGIRYRTDPPATSGAKVVILDTDHLGAKCEWCETAWVWRAFTRGYHVALLDDWEDNVARRKGVRRGINDTLGYGQKIRLIDMAPQNESQATPCSTRYCLYTSDDPDPLPYVPAVPNGHQYLAFKPDGVGSVTIHDLPAGTYSGEWLNVATSSVRSIAAFSHPGGNKNFTSPWSAEASALWIKDGSPSVCPN